MRVLSAAVSLAAVLCVGAVVAAAQGPPPTVTVSGTATTVTGPTAPVAPGATRFEFGSTDAKTEFSVFLAALEPGRTVAEVTAALRASPTGALELVQIAASATLAPGERRAITVDVEPSTTVIARRSPGRAWHSRRSGRARAPPWGSRGERRRSPRRRSGPARAPRGRR